MITLSALIDEINKEMIMNGITQVRISELSGLSKDAINKLLTGSRKSVNTDTLFAVMNALEMCKDEKLLADNEYKDKIINLFHLLSQMPSDKRERVIKLLEDFTSVCIAKD